MSHACWIPLSRAAQEMPQAARASRWQAYTAALRPVAMACIDAFGTDRCLFGSDFPVAGLHIGYAEWCHAFAAIVAGFTPAEQRAMFCDNARRLYRMA